MAPCPTVPKPRSKLRSSRNSIRHGVLARTIVLQEEIASSFNNLLAAFEQELQPHGPVERSCVENMAAARWRMLRLWGMEKAGLQLEMARQDPSLQDAPTRAAGAFRTLCDDSRSADLLNRYEIRYDRQYARALNLLLRWRGVSNPLPAENENFHTNPISKSDTAL